MAGTSKTIGGWGGINFTKNGRTLKQFGIYLGPLIGRDEDKTQHGLYIRREGVDGWKIAALNPTPEQITEMGEMLIEAAKKLKASLITSNALDLHVASTVRELLEEKPEFTDEQVLTSLERIIERRRQLR